jgi:hypothetical protein
MISSLALACACSANGPAFDSVATLPDAGRHPPGVSVDPAGELPARTARGRTASGVVVLGTPTDPGTIRGVVRAYFHAIVEESPSELEALIHPRAVVLARSRQLGARDYLLSRFARYDYGSLRGSVIYREEELEVTEPDPTESRERAARAGLEPDVDQRLVRIRIVAQSAGRPRLFADDLTLRLVAHGSGWVVLEIAEEF